MEENIKTEKNQEVQEDKKGFRIGDLFQGLHVKDIFLGRFISNDILIHQWKTHSGNLSYYFSFISATDIPASKKSPRSVNYKNIWSMSVMRP